MRRPVVSLLILALTGGGAVLFASCGEEDARLLPGDTAREITANLDTVQQLADEGDCVGAESAALQVSEQVEALGNVDERLQRALREGAERLNEVVAGCEEEGEAVAPETIEPETETTPADEEEEKEREKQERAEEKEEEKERREEEREEKETPPPLPPQSEGEDDGSDDDDDGESGPGGNEGEGTPSGGVSPGTPAGEGE